MGLLSFFTSGVAKKVGSEISKLAVLGEVKKLTKYVRKNLPSFRQKVLELIEETKQLIVKASVPKKSLFAFGENKGIDNAKKDAINNLEYLYLVRDYFILLAKVQDDVHLEDDEYTFVVKFTPFFDGKYDGKTVSSLDEEGQDNSLMGQLKSMGNEILGEFISTNKDFSYEALLDGYREKIKNLVIPDVDSAMERFKKVAAEKEPSEKETPQGEQLPQITSTKLIICPVCQCNLPENSKFCNECGAKIELVTPKFCPQCGASLTAGVKFCSECGTKI